MSLGQGNLLNNRYRVDEILGRGGMGAVYRATDESLGVEVAVKENLFTSDDFARQFRMEAVILAGIRHPNLPRVTDHFVINGLGQYLVMDYIDGNDLRQVMEKTGPISENEAIRIGAAACDALAYLHSRKPPILHRDIKLGNIKISNDGQIYLVDFGLAKMGWEHEVTMTGARAMTPGYSPPEQYGSARTDSRSDIYSLGATLYAALSGIIPEDSLMRAVDGVALTPLREHRPDISPRLASVIEKALEINSSNRYQTAEAFKRALLGQPEPDFNPGDADTLPPAPPLPPDMDDTPRRPSPFWRMFAFFLIMLAIVFGALWFSPLGRDSLQSRLFSLPAYLSTQIPLLFPANTPTATTSLTLSPSPSPNPTATSPAILTATRTPLAVSTVTSTVTRTTTSTVTLTPVQATATITPTKIPATATSTRTETPPATPFGSGRGEIGFSTIIDGAAQIIIADVDGTNLRRLTEEPTGACSFDWSPDGNELVFVSPCYGKANQYPNSGLYLLDVATGITNPLPFTAAGDFEPAWSPDGKKIAFTSLRDGSMQIYLFNLGDATLYRLTSPSDNSQSRYPAWSPDSTRIAYTVLRLGLLQIWTMNADGGNKQQLVRTGGSLSEYLPAWSPDGSYLLYSETDNSLTVPSALTKYELNTGVITQLSIARPVVDVSFSPDGAWIAYETTDSVNQDIYTCHLPDGTPRRLTTAPETDFDPSWRPGH